ncbi:MAG: site-specific integrase, partial [Planctomycetaceae bacterium]|nr:site-specific integrase [Planctomycetaceae bacterium]
KLTPQIVSSLYATLAKKGVNPRHVQLIHCALHSALNLAVHPWRLIGFNPCHRLRPKAEKPELACPTPDEIIKFLISTRGDRAHALYMMAATGGFRIGELTGLQWDDIDLDAGKVTIRRTITYVAKGFVTSTPKSAKSRRCVSIPPVTVAALRDHQRIMLREGFAGSEWVFVTLRGTHLLRQSTNVACRRAMKMAGVTPQKFHSLRHGFASTLLADGVPVTVVQEKLGHASARMTLDVYAHSLPESHRDADEKLQRRFGAVAS